MEGKHVEEDYCCQLVVKAFVVFCVKNKHKKKQGRETRVESSQEETVWTVADPFCQAAASHGIADIKK